VQARAVFVHGFDGDLSTWDGVWKELKGNLSALRYDLRGFGHSVPREHTQFTHADDLLELLDAAAIAQCDLVAVSLGGSIALNFAIDHSERVRNLILISPGLLAWEWSEGWLKLWQPIVEHARKGEIDDARRLWWRHPLFSSTRPGTSGQLLFDSIARFRGTQWVTDLHRPVQPDIERLHLLKARTLLMTGGRDFEDFKLIADIIEAAAGNVTRRHYPALGHLLQLEDPQECARQILAFLSSSPT
jgi:pimeloyl-ACP methyl ester carboxylesterase